MSAAADAVAGEIAGFRNQAGAIRQVFRINLEGITHEESLVQPRPAGNCLNFVVGHLVNVHNGVLAMLGQEPAIDDARIARYARGSRPLTDPAEATDLETLKSAWEMASDRIDAGLAALTPEFLDQRAASSPTNNPNETNRTLIGTVLFHQAYHLGQLGLLRRIVGKPGAIP